MHVVNARQRDGTQTAWNEDGPPHPRPLPPVQVVDSLLDEVVSAGVERALDPTLLEVSVLDRCLAALE